MEIYELSVDGGVKRISELPCGVRLVCAFGCFDGVHIGHQALLSEAVRVAHDARSCVLDVGNTLEYAPAVWTFSEPVSKPWVISIKERLALCGRFGIRYALCQRFEDVRTFSPEEFIDVLVSEYSVRHGVCGGNFRFGYKGAGDPERLDSCIRGALGRFGHRGVSESGSVSVVADVCELGGIVSSTRIRGLLSEGEVESAGVLLGRPYSLLGIVLAGKQIGRTISRPTANLVYSPDQLIPKHGVYFTYCRVKGKLYRAVTNVGYRPTVNSDVGSVTCEAHILDFSEAVYGECAEIIFVHYHRAETAFASVEALSEQITRDVACASEFFNGIEQLETEKRLSGEK